VADDGLIFAKSLLVVLNSGIPQVDKPLILCLLFPSPEATVSKSFRAVIISIPEQGANRSWTLPSIETVMVERSFFEEKNKAYCHRVAFHYGTPMFEALIQLAPAGG
jgi:hypothetical protein